MTGKRRNILIGMAAGGFWGVGLIWVGLSLDIPIFSFTWILTLAFLFPGLFLIVIIGRLAQRRFFDDAIIDGEPLTGAAAIDQRVLQNTAEQLVLALAIWPFAGQWLATEGPGVVLMLGIGFAIARIAFWAGYHISPPLRAFGFAATFYPTIIVLIWTVLWWVLN